MLTRSLFLYIILLFGVCSYSIAQESKKVTFTHFGHACYLITTSNQTKILIDPMKLEGYSIPDSIKPDVVTVSHRHIDHDNFGDVAGEPKVLIGVDGPMKKAAEHKFIPIDTQFNGVRIFDLSSNHFNPKVNSYLNAIFVYEFDGIRVVHLGDLGMKLTDEQKAIIGPVDILMIPIGGVYTINPSGADSVIAQLQPKMIVFPMHYKTTAATFLDFTAEDFLKIKKNVQLISGSTLIFDLSKPPKELQYVVMNASDI